MTTNSAATGQQVTTPRSSFPEIGDGIEELTVAALPTLDEDQLRRAMTYAVEEQVTAGQVVVDAGAENTDLMMCGSAVLEAVRGDGGPESAVVERWSAGQFAGELDVLTGGRRTLAIRAASEGVIGRIDERSFRLLMARETDLSDLILRSLLARRRVIRLAAEQSLRLVGDPDAGTGLALRTFLQRQGIPHSWAEPDSPAASKLMDADGLSPADLPAAVTGTTVIRNVTPGRLADHLGLSFRRTGVDCNDLVVVGAGPAGLAAAVYGASEGLTTVLLDAVATGGQAATSARIENFVGFPFGVSGGDLTARAAVQALKFGARIASPCRVVALRPAAHGHTLELADGVTLHTRAVVLATGAEYRALPVPGWDRFTGSGIYYAATDLEATAVAGRPVVVVGGANSAGQAALQLRRYASSVTMLVRAADLGVAMSSYLVERIRADDGIAVHTSSEVTALHGVDRLDTVEFSTRGDDAAHAVACAGLFSFIGAVPASGWFEGIALDDDGFVRTDVQLRAVDLADRWSGLGPPLPWETSRPGVFAAGDVRSGSVKRVAAAVGEGSSAVRSVHQALARLSDRQG